MRANTASATAAVVDLFAGAGGLGLGAERAGADLRLSVEIDPVACETLRANASGGPSTVLEADVTGVRATACFALNAPDSAAWDYSDHCPVVADLQL